MGPDPMELIVDGDVPSALPSQPQPQLKGGNANEASEGADMTALEPQDVGDQANSTGTKPEESVALLEVHQPSLEVDTEQELSEDAACETTFPGPRATEVRASSLVANEAQGTEPP